MSIGSIVANLTGGNLFSGLADFINAIRGKSPEDAAKLEQLTLQYQEELQQAAQKMQAAQITVNTAEAKNTNWMVAGWRPYIGWICGTGLAIQFIVAPLADWASALLHHPVVMPSLDLGTLMTLLMGMLGLGGMRTYEKISGVQGKH